MGTGRKLFLKRRIYGFIPLSCWDIFPFRRKTSTGNSAGATVNREFGGLKETPLMSECIFCQMVKKEISVNALYEDEHALAFDDINPQARVHVLVIPKRHVISLDDAKEPDADLLGRLLLICGQIARERGVAAQ